MKLPAKLAIASMALFPAANLSFGETATATTDPVGYVKQQMVGGGDTFISLSFPREMFRSGVVTSVNGSAISLTVSEPLSANELVYVAGTQPNTYYAQIMSGSASGQYATITANTDSSITAEFEADILGALVAGDRVAIFPYWTLGTLFPAADAGSSFIASTSNLGSGRRTEIILPDLASTGINKAPEGTYFFNSNWRRVGNVSANANDTIILPDAYLTIRGNNYASNTELVMTGSVVSKFVVPLTAGTIKTDNSIGIPIPARLTFDQLNLVQSGAFTASTNNLGSGRRDELIVYTANANTPAFNRSPEGTYFYNGFWRKVGDVSADRSGELLPENAVLVIRKYETNQTVTVDWPIQISLN
jgi:uncharacterized protein (TIGR02597 family)